MRSLIEWTFLSILVLVLGIGAASARDPVRRIALISAFSPELTLVKTRIQDAETTKVNGVTFTSGTLAGHQVVAFLSGISMVNAAMTTQLALDRFNIASIVFSGIAGGVNPELHIGDVVVPKRWGQYLEARFAREAANGEYTLPEKSTAGKLPNFGMIFPEAVEVVSAAHPDGETRFWFPVDAAMLATAKKIAGTVSLHDCTGEDVCLEHLPRVVVGGNGVSGQAFVDNAAFRKYTFQTFHANVLDMESAASATVAYANGVPFIAFRSLSDLAGGGPGENQIETFFQLAADNAASVVIAFLRQWRATDPID